jgi:hypothetical protein
MGPRKYAGFDRDGSNRVQVATVDPLRAIQDLLAHDPVLDLFELLVDVPTAVGVLNEQGLDDLFLDRLDTG